MVGSEQATERINNETLAGSVNLGEIDDDR